MYRKNPLRFASQPDDSLAEKRAIEKLGAESVLVWANGGCNFLNLKSEFPSLTINAFDNDVVEMEHLKSKISCLKRGDSEHLNLNHNDQDGLSQSGKFESLLRIVRRFFFEFVVEPEGFNEIFWEAPEQQRTEILDQIFSSPAWERAFSMFFSKLSLEALVGGIWADKSCSRVRENVETLLRRPDVLENYFLKHFFMGEYDDAARPRYFDSLGKDLAANSEFFVKNLWEIDLKEYSVISIGSYLDFLGKNERSLAIRHLKSQVGSGRLVVVRSLLESPDYLTELQPDFFLDIAWGKELFLKDQSFLSSQLVMVIKE